LSYDGSHLITRKSLSVLDPVLIFSKKLRSEAVYATALLMFNSEFVSSSLK